MNIFEIERKFLIKKPDESELLRLPGCTVTEITQTYLECPEGVSLRVRKSVCGGKTVYTKTEKRHVSNIKRIELEEEITEEDYLRARKDACPDLRTVEKVRYRVPHGGQLLEIDVFPFWERQAYLEVELGSEGEEIMIPDYIEVIREVTEDKRYTNHALAREIPGEDL